MNIAVGSLNPVKIKAVEAAFVEFFDTEKIVCEGISVPSGVSDQPLSHDETVKGASQRARLALTSGDFDCGVGLEGGIFQVGDRWFNTAWVAIAHGDFIALGQAPAIELPHEVVSMIQKESLELGDAADRLFAQHNIKQKQGLYGELTKGLITRQDMSRAALISALAAVDNSQIYTTH